MLWLKRSVALAALLLGIAGVAACLVGIVYVWNIRGQVDDAVARISVRVDDLLARVELRTNRVTQTIESAQNSVRQLNARVQQRVAERRDVPLEEAADIDELERQLVARIQLAGDWIGFIQSTIDLVGQLTQTVESAFSFAKGDEHTMADLIGAVRDGRKEIERTSKLVEDVKTSLADIRAHRDLDANAEQITTLSSLIDTSLAKAGRHAEGFLKAVAQARVDCADLATRIRRQTTVVAVLLTVILIWIAVAQLSLAIHGRKALR